jgi:glycerophosphoryl diester phosphodiesterase
MGLKQGLEHWFQKGIDLFFSVLPQPVPAKEALEACHIVSHRGEHDNQTVFENTLPAFDAAHEKGVWGIEFDLRWTRDLQPVVCHDMDLKRVFGQDTRVSRVTFNELKKRCPLVPGLHEVIERYGGRMHFMMEIKEEPYPDPHKQNGVLRDLFASLSAGLDFHLVTLSPTMLPLMEFTDKSACLLIAEWNIRQMSRLAIKNEYGGLNGHYLLYTRALMQRHKRLGQQVGTGYIASKNALYRELNRGVDFIFSNNAAEVQGIRDAALAAR